MGEFLQHAIVTVIAAVALLVLVRPWLPAKLGGRRGDSAGDACASCAANAAARATGSAPDPVRLNTIPGGGGTGRRVPPADAHRVPGIARGERALGSCHRR
jgi:hypothetical protein